MLRLPSFERGGQKHTWSFAVSIFSTVLAKYTIKKRRENTTPRDW
jgi:hypothetical protein